MLKDNKSKFSSLIQVRETIDLHTLKDKKLVLQTGKAVLFLDIKKQAKLK